MEELDLLRPLALPLLSNASHHFLNLFLEDVNLLQLVHHLSFLHFIPSLH
jgi:hypothetical protein